MFCVKCGKEIAEGTRFCPGCGQEVGAAPKGESALAGIAKAASEKLDGLNRKLDELNEKEEETEKSTLQMWSQIKTRQSLLECTMLYFPKASQRMAQPRGRTDSYRDGRNRLSSDKGRPGGRTSCLRCGFLSPGHHPLARRKPLRNIRPHRNQHQPRKTRRNLV